MQLKSKDAVIVSGTLSKDAECKKVGENDTLRCAFSLKVGTKPNPDGGDKQIAVWCNCVAWRELAKCCKRFRKGDCVFAIGRIDEREYEGKTYRDLVVEFAIAMPNYEEITAAGSSVFPEPASDFTEFETNEYEDDLPF